MQGGDLPDCKPLAINANTKFLFIGDSIFSELTDHLTIPDFQVLCLPDYTMETAANRILSTQAAPRFVALHFGTRDIPALNDPKEIFKSATKLLDAAKLAFPTAEIHLVSVLYRPDVDPYFIDQVNEELNEACFSTGCLFLQLSQSIENGHMKEDGIHLNQRGLLRLCDCLEEVTNLAPDDDFIDWLSSPSRSIQAANSEETQTVAAFWAKPAEDRPTWCFEPQARLFIEATIGGVEMKVLLDSGATNSLLPSSSIPILTSRGIKVNPSDTTVNLADGGPAKLVGKATIPVIIGGTSWIGEFYFMDSLPYQALLGVDCMRGTKMNIDFSLPAIKVKTVNGAREVPIIHLCCLSLEEPETDSREVPLHPDLTPGDFVEFNDFISTWKEEFKTSPALTSIMHHKIYLEPNTVPVKQRHYPVSPYLQEIITKEIDSLLEKGHIEDSQSPWSSPLVLVPKKNTLEKRVCVDFRALNARTIKNSYPLPYLQSVLDSLKDSYFVSAIDLKSGFHQIPLDDESKPLTAFTVPGGGGLYQYKVMPFGLCNAPATFQNLMDVVLRPLLKGGRVRVYMDDLVVTTKTFDEHIAVLNDVFRLLLHAGLSVNWEKSRFLQPEVEYLGHVVGRGTLKPSPGKVSAILEYPEPRTIKQIRSFLGACAWFKRFIPNFAHLAEPLTRLLRKDEPWKWDAEQKEAFNQLKIRLTTSPVLRCPNFDLPFVVETDASNVGLGAVLRQKENDENYVVAYASRTLNRAERNLATTHKELLGVLFGIEKFRPYIEGSHFKLVTDHTALQWLQTTKNPTGKFARWILRISQYDFEVIHRPGSLMPVSDCLSRGPYNVKTETDIEIAACSLDMTVPDISKSTDPWYTNLKNKITDLQSSYPAFRIVNDIMYKSVYDSVTQRQQWRIVVPTEMRKKIIESCHNPPTAGHFGFKKTLERIKQDYYWPNMYVTIRAYVAKCLLCQQFKASNNVAYGTMSDDPPCMKPMRLWTTDIVGPLPRSLKQNKFILVAEDVATKFVVAAPMRSATTSAVKKILLNEVILVHGAPELLLADNGSAFISKEFKEFCSQHSIELRHVPKYYPRGNMVERANRVIKTALSIYSSDNQRNWDDYIRHIAFAVNTSVSETTSFTPARLVYGRELRPLHSIIPSCNNVVGDFDPAFYNENLEKDTALNFEKALECLQKAKTKQSQQYNLRHRIPTFAVGDIVWRRNFALSQGANNIAAKLLPKFIGPFSVKKKLSPSQYLLVTMNGKDAGRWPSLHLKHVT